jgi:voltage-dependent calcium channel T type alpha-1I
MDTYIDSFTGEITEISQMVDYTLNFIFITECLLKVISRGLIVGEEAYLKNTWNRLDFFIVCMSIVDMVLSGVNLNIIKLLRTLRPLRIITRNE